MNPLRLLTFVALIAVLLGLVSCAPAPVGACYLSHDPVDTSGPALCHYPVARQGKLTAWLTSNHRQAAGEWLYAPNDASIRHHIIGIIRAPAMPSRPQHDGAFLLTSDYTGPIYSLWCGTESKGLMYGGPEEGWLQVSLHQDKVVNTWVKRPGRLEIGQWSGYPVVIGDPARPEAVAGAMWYRSNSDPSWGGATSTRLMKYWTEHLRFADFVDPEHR